MGEPPVAAAAAARRTSWTVGLLLALTGLAALAIHLRFASCSRLIWDDFQMLDSSWTWSRTWATLTLSHNEHLMPLGRLLVAVLVQLGGSLPATAALLSYVGPLALLLGMGLVYLFVRREVGQPGHALLATMLFGVSTTYMQALHWFAASLAICALDTLLAGLLAAQAWRQTGRRGYLVLAVVAVLLAPGWYGSGLLAGPLVCLYLLGSPPTPDSPPALRQRFRILDLAPLLGSLLFVAFSLLLATAPPQRPFQYDRRSPLEAFAVGPGLALTLQSILDNLISGLRGQSEVHVQAPWSWVALVLLGLVALWAWLRGPRPGLVVLGLGMIVGSYLLIYGARYHSGLDERINGYVWNRYHLQPQLGLALVICGALPLRKDAALSRRETGILGLLLVLLFLIHAPRAWHTLDPLQPEQAAVLRHIDAVDALCRQERIDANTARAVLPPLPLPCGPDDVGAWTFLRGSPDPLPWTPEEARRLLEASGKNLFHKPLSPRGRGVGVRGELPGG